MNDGADIQAEQAAGLRDTARTMPVSPETMTAVAFAAVALFRALTATWTNDEGYLAYLGAVSMAEAPLDVLFFQKFHPALSAAMAPFAAISWRTFLVAHVAIASAAIYMLGATGRRWWGRHGWIAALFVALSPVYLESASTGQSNSSGVFVVALVLFLARSGARWSLATGFVVGAALWTRYEAAPYLAGWLLFELWRTRDPRLLVGALGVPAAYIAAGAIYHGDVLWVLHYPPTLVVPEMPSTIVYAPSAPAFVEMQLRRFFLVSPALAMLFAFDPLHERDSRIRALAVIFALTVLTQLALPLAGEYFNYDFANRYVLNHLTFGALMAAGLLADRPPGRPLCAVFVPALVAVAVWASFDRPLTLLFAVPALLPLLMVRLSGNRTTIAAVALSLASIASYHLLGVAKMESAPEPPAQFVEFMRAHASGTTAFTNLHSLDTLMDVAVPDAEVRYLTGYDMLVELGTLLHTDHRQSRRVMEVLGPRIYGVALRPCELPFQVPAGSLLVLSGDPRVREVYPIEQWTAASEELAHFPRMDVTVYRAPAPIDLPRAPLPGWMSPAIFETGCYDIERGTE